MRTSPPGKRILVTVLGLGAVLLVWLYCWQYQRDAVRRARVIRRADALATAQILGGKAWTTVPFSLRYGWIIVRATLAGRPCDCMVDTGTSYVQWPTALAVGGRRMGTGVSEYWPDHLSPARHADYVVLASIRLGSYEVNNLPTVAYDHVPGDASSLRMPILGNDFFRDTALTIDYPARKLIICPKPRSWPYISSPDCRRAPVSWTRELLGPSLPIAAGSIGGLPARFLIDTGASPLAGALVDRSLDAGLRLRHQSYRRTNVISAVGFFDVSWCCAGVTDQGSIPYVPALQGNGFDAILGAKTLQSYRVTLDYRHSWIQLLRYPSSGTKSALWQDNAGH